ncbi:hypothetical protein [Kribbella sp. NPDC051620]|uniref:hypothetical protein n=1 Tax=Kribbella sp. NPDC051620 TaxID=3364120 RepID=UPI0037AC1F29
MSSQVPVRIGTATAGRRVTEDAIELAGYCSRPSCRKQFQQATGPGRKREFCSETCRRLADKEHKQAQARVAHFADLLYQSRIDVLAFGRDDDEDRATLTPEAEVRMMMTAHGAIQRAELLLETTENDDLPVRELRSVVSAVGPLLESFAAGRSTS